MPTRAKRPCHHTGCPALVDGTYCEHHQHKTKREDTRIGGSTARGYDARWQRFRLSYLHCNPLCVDCLKRGDVTASKEVHHIAKLKEQPDLKYDDDNLMALCRACHQRRTARGE